MKLALVFAAAVTIAATSPAVAVTAPVLSTYEFTGDCEDCFFTVARTSAAQPTSPATATLVLQNYTPGQQLTDSNFYSFSYTSDIQSFTSMPGPFTTDTLSGVLGATPGFYDVDFGENFGFIFGVYTTFATHKDGTWEYNQSQSLPLFGNLDHGINGSWRLAGAPPVNGAVPEPASWALMLAGFGALGVAMRRRPRTAVTFG